MGNKIAYAYLNPKGCRRILVVNLSAINSTLVSNIISWIMLDDIFLIALLLVAYLYWSKAQQAKELALKAARAHCLDMEVQMLDEYVALDGIRLKRDEAGKVHMRRSFLFEFSSTGNERYNGRIVMLGCQVESIHMEPYRFE